MTNSEKRLDYSSLTDEMLISLLKNGNKNAFTVLIQRHTKLISALSCTYHADALTADDWFQEGMIGFLSAVHTFSETNNASFETYASVCIKNRLNSVWRTTNSNKNAPLNNSVAYSDMCVPAVNSPEDDYINNEQYQFFTNNFIEQLSATEQKVFICYLSGFSYCETAKKLGINEKSVDNALCRAKSKLKKALKN